MYLVCLLIFTEWPHNVSTKLNFLGDTQGLLGEKYGNIRIPGEVEASEFEMILDAAIEAKLETKLLEEWYCRDENSVPAAYYLRPKSEMLKSNKNAVSYLSLQRYILCLCHPGVVFSSEKAQKLILPWTLNFLLTMKSKAKKPSIFLTHLSF